MFDRVFKKKDESSYTDLTRRSRVDKQKAAEYMGRRPRTAPASPSISSTGDENKTIESPRHRHSLGEGILSSHSATPGPFYDEPASFAFLPPPAPVSNDRTSDRTPRSSRRWKDSPCPPMVPEAPEGSNELRNPFRNNTSESACSTGRSDSLESFADTGVPVHRIVRSFRPAQIIEDGSHRPQKAAIFTTGGGETSFNVPSTTSSATSNPFADSHATSAPTSRSATVDGFPLTADGTTAASPRSGSRRWSILKSPRRGSYDFLQVKIPTAVMSPVRESRLAFWSKA